MLNVVLALLVQYSKLTAEEAERISHEIEYGVVPARYKDAEALIKRVIADGKDRDLVKLL